MCHEHCVSAASAGSLSSGALRQRDTIPERSPLAEGGHALFDIFYLEREKTMDLSAVAHLLPMSYYIVRKNVFFCTFKSGSGVKIGTCTNGKKSSCS